jgi:hypothetical protein
LPSGGLSKTEPFFYFGDSALNAAFRYFGDSYFGDSAVESTRFGEETGLEEEVKCTVTEIDGGANILIRDIRFNLT